MKYSVNKAVLTISKYVNDYLIQPTPTSTQSQQEDQKQVEQQEQQQPSS